MSEPVELSSFLSDYLNDAQEGFQQINAALLALEKNPRERERLDEVFRAFHTLKSASAMLDFGDVAELAHVAEDFLARLRNKELPVAPKTLDVVFELADALQTMVNSRAVVKGGKERPADFDDLIRRLKERTTGFATPAGRVRGPEPRQQPPAAGLVETARTVRVREDLLDFLFNLAGELIIISNRINTTIPETATKELKDLVARMSRTVREVHEITSVARLTRADEVFQKFPRMVRDLAKQTGKQVDFVIEGAEIELDKGVLDAINEPLIHLLRNAVSHGIETPDARRRQNKAETGTVKLIAKRLEDHIVILVEDDGAGIDTTRIKDIAAGRGLLETEEMESLPDRDVIDLLFQPGFSGAGEVTGVSGRGVGLDVVKTAVKRLGGVVEVATEKGQGTRFTLKLPLTTAIMQTLMVDVGKRVFAIPATIVSRTMEIAPEYLQPIQNDRVFVLDNEIIPFVKLDEVLGIPGNGDRKKVATAIVRIGGKAIGLGVDAVLGQVESIVKPFDPIAQRLPGFLGGTILGDGRVALMLDVPSLFGPKTLRKESSKL